MAGTRRSRNRRSARSDELEYSNIALDMDGVSSDIEQYAKEVLSALIRDSLPPTPNNFSLYFDRLLEDKSESFRQQVISMLELEESNDAERSIGMEQSLKQGFGSIKNILNATASIYKNMSLMTKILEKRRQELEDDKNHHSTIGIAVALENDVQKLNSILKKQSTSMKELYDETAGIVKSIEHETIFDNKFGVYNKRYFLSKVEKEISLVKEFGHKSSLMLIELSKDLRNSVENEKALILMTKTISRLLLKTSRRSDIVAHYGNGIFGMLLKYTDVESAKKASERLCYLVSNTNFFLADSEVHLRISIGITDVTTNHSVEEIVVSAITAMEKAYNEEKVDYAIELR